MNIIFLPAYIVIIFFGLLVVGAIVAFVSAVLRERKYKKTALPSLEDDNDNEVEFSEKTEDTEEESLFSNLNDEIVMDDDETNQIIKNMNKIDKIKESKGNKKPFPSWLTQQKRKRG